jgi:nuclear pore complex protein Nup133
MSRTANLAARPSFHRLFIDLASTLANGDAVDIEGLVDLLTLKANHGDGESGDPATALERLWKDQVCDGRLATDDGHRL